MILTKPGEQHSVNIPDHREVRVGTLLKELKKAGLTRDEFIELLGR